MGLWVERKDPRTHIYGFIRQAARFGYDSDATPMSVILYVNKRQ